jgi:hypothetical protein
MFVINQLFYLKKLYYYSKHHFTVRIAGITVLWNIFIFVVLLLFADNCRQYYRYMSVVLSTIVGSIVDIYRQTNAYKCFSKLNTYTRSSMNVDWELCRILWELG